MHRPRARAHIVLANGTCNPNRVYGPRVTESKNIGRDHLKPVRNSKYKPHQGKRERERRLRQMAEGRLS